MDDVESNAYLAYGITVTTESLLYATEAWPRLQGAFAFFDLVLLRRRNGTLAAQVSSSRATSAVQSVPTEAWDLVRHKLVDQELREAEITHLDSLRCEDCHVDRFDPFEMWSTLPRWNCTACYEGLASFEGFSDKTREQALRTLLRRFRLALPTSTSIRSTSDLEPWPLQACADPETATMISLPSPVGSSDDVFGIHAGCGGDVRPDAQAVVDVDFSVPEGATQRFHRLVSDLHLQLVDVTDGLIAHEGSKQAERGSVTRHKERKFEEVPLAQLKPRWKLINIAVTTW